jgi:hypothetical protein
MPGTNVRSPTTFISWSSRARCRAAPRISFEQCSPGMRSCSITLRAIIRPAQSDRCYIGPPIWMKPRTTSGHF